MKPIEQILFDGFHSDPGFVHFHLNIGVRYPDRFHFLFRVFHFYPGIEVGDPGWFRFHLGIEVPGPDRFHFYLNASHFFRDIGISNPGKFYFDFDWFHFNPNRPYTARSVEVQNY